MNRTMLTATNTMSQLQKKLDVIGHNLANIDTNGFKRREATFTELMYQQFDNQPDAAREIGRLTPNGVRQGVGSKIAHTELVLTQGSLKGTDRSLDIAFTKPNQFLKVLVQENDVSSVQYTRDGSLHVTPVGENEVMLVNGQGYPVLDENENIIVMAEGSKDLQFSQEGQLTNTLFNGQQQRFNLGVIEVNKPQFFEQKGENTIGLPNDLDVNEAVVMTDLTGELRNNVSIKQFSLEKSNVEMAKEMSELVNVQRSYQFQARSVTIADQMMGLVNGIR